MTVGSSGSTAFEWLQRRSSSPVLIKRPLDEELNDEPAQVILRKSKGMSPRALARRMGLDNLGTSSRTTVIFRDNAPQPRASLQALLSSPVPLPVDTLSSISSHGTDKSSVVGNCSTRRTSLESKLSESPPVKASPRRRHNRRHPWSKSSPDGGTLQTIDEGYYQPQPTIDTVERASAAKIYLETHFNNLLNEPSSRVVRLQYLKSQLYCNSHLNPKEKDVIRQSFYFQESCHSREMRAIKTRSLLSLTKENLSQADRYDFLKILGHGSFGVVKLVREKPDDSHAFPQQVFAMKVIRKSDMIRSCQEGHLRAERDVLVASEGSEW